MMKIAVTGATGNLGTSLIESLVRDDSVTEIVGIARRVPDIGNDKVRWHGLDLTTDRIDPVLQGVDAVVHLAWAIQPSHRPEVLRRVNIGGSRRVFEAARRTGVGALVVASSVGAYSPRRTSGSDDPVDESWPTEGIESSRYSLDKVEVEQMLDEIEADSDMRIARMRPSLIFKGDAAPRIKQLFLGALVPTQLLRRRKIPLLPLPRSLRLQVTHSADVASAFHAAVTHRASGAFNVASDPVLTRDEIARLLGGRPVDVPAPVLRAVVDASWRGRLQNTSPGWFDLAMQVPLLDSTRTRSQLRWSPSVQPRDAFTQLIDGLAHS